MEIRAPTRGNRRLEALFAAANGDDRVRAWWHMQQVVAERLGMSDHSWVHVQIVVNIALRLFRLLDRAGVEPAMVADHGMRAARRGGGDRRRPACSTTRACRSTAPTTRPTACSSPPSACRCCLSRLYEEPELHRGRGRGAARGHRPPPPRRPDDRRGRRSCAWRTPSTWPRAARACRSRPAAPTSTRCRPPPSTRSRSSRARSGRADRDRHEQLVRPLPGGRATGHQAARLGPRGAPRGGGAHRRRAREALCRCSGSEPTQA